MPATAMPFGLLSQVCHTACSSFACVRAATMSLTQLHSFAPHSVALHSVAQFISAGFSSSAAFFYFARRQPHLGCVHLASANCSCRTSISQSIAKVHLHSSAAYVPFGKFTPAASYGASIVCSHLAQLLYIARNKWLQLYCWPLCGGSLSTSIHSFLILSGGHQRLAITSVPIPKAFGTARLCFFFAAGAFTGRLHTFANASKKTIPS
jgi:hypothetical protein